MRQMGVIILKSLYIRVATSNSSKAIFPLTEFVKVTLIKIEQLFQIVIQDARQLAKGIFIIEDR